MARASELPGPPAPDNPGLCDRGRGRAIFYRAVRPPTVHPERHQFRASALLAYHLYECDRCRRVVADHYLLFLDHFAHVWADAGIAEEQVPAELERA